MVLLSLISASIIGCTLPGADEQDRSVESSTVIWYEAQRAQRAWPSRDELAVFTEKNYATTACERQAASTLHPRAGIVEKLTSGFICRIPRAAIASNIDVDRRIDQLKALGCVSNVGLVYYTSERRDPATRLIHTDELIVRFDESMESSKMVELESKFGLVRKQALHYAPNTMIYTAHKPRLVIEQANRLRRVDGVIYAYPNWMRQRIAK